MLRPVKVLLAQLIYNGFVKARSSKALLAYAITLSK
jgi:hypothetical protein